MKCNIGIVIILLSLSFASSRLGKTKNDNLMYLDSIKFQNQEVTFPSNEVAFDKGTISETGIKLIIKKTSIDKFPQQILSFFDTYVPKKVKGYNKDYLVYKVVSIENIGKQVVYNLSACTSRTYLANNIITHNNIFQFRGADGAVFTKLEDFDLYKLDYNYRSYQEIINYACTVYEKLKPAVEDNEECYITSIDFADESSIICNRGYGGSVSIIDPFGNGKHIKNKVNYYMDTKRQKEVFDEFIKTNPMILCRTNKQVKAIQEFGYSNVSTVHQAKGLEYDNVIVIDTTIRNMEDLNIAYVALTRARDNMLVINWSNLEQMWLQQKKSSSFGWII